MTGCAPSQLSPTERRRLVSEARRLEYFLYKIHEYFHYTGHNGNFHVIRCDDNPGAICLLASVGLGVIPVESYLRWRSGGRKDEPVDKPMAPPEPVRPRDGISTETAHRDDDWVADYEWTVHCRRMWMLRLLAITLLTIGIAYYITMDILYPTGVTP